MLHRLAPPLRRQARAFSMWSHVEMGPPDPILGLTEAFQKDTDAKKIGLQVGAYRGDDGKPLVLESVREAERRIYEAKMNHEYAGIVGVADFNKLSLEFAYGADSAPIAEGRVAVTQTLSGTGACRLVGEFLSRFVGAGSPIDLPNPTWGNHIPIMKDAGLEVRRLSYLDSKTNGLDFAGRWRTRTPRPTARRSCCTRARTTRRASTRRRRSGTRSRR